MLQYTPRILNIPSRKTENIFPQAQKNSRQYRGNRQKEHWGHWGHQRHRRPENQVKHAKQLFLRYLCGNIKSQFQLMTIETKHNRKHTDRRASSPACPEGAS